MIEKYVQYCAMAETCMYMAEQYPISHDRWLQRATKYMHEACLELFGHE